MFGLIGIKKWLKLNMIWSQLNLSITINRVYWGIFCAHLRAILFAAARVDVFCNSGVAFQTLVIRFVARAGYPGTGTGTLAFYQNCGDFG